MLGDALLVGALLAALSGLGLSLLAAFRRLRPGTGGQPNIHARAFLANPDLLSRTSHLLALLLALLLLAMTAFMIFLFFTSDLTYLYVWSHSSTDLPWWYKLSGFWSGIPGSFLLWILLIAMSYLLLPFLARGVEPVTLDIVRGTMLAILSVFLVIFALTDPWTRTNPAMNLARPDGVGLNVLLRSPWMLIHPPILFTGYAFSVIPFAAAIARVVRPGTDWTAASMPFARISWVFLTAAVTLGAHWAYYVIGWGGYWAWDPVETSSLLPWIAMTAFLHAQVMKQRKGLFANSAPLLATLPFILTLLATFVTRTGVWVSVHSFATLSAGSNNPFVRLGNVLNESQALVLVLGLLVAAAATALLIAFRLLAPVEAKGWRSSLFFAVAGSAVIAGVVVQWMLSSEIVPREVAPLAGPALFAGAFIACFAGATAIWALWGDEGEEPGESVSASPTIGLRALVLESRFLTTKNLLMLGVLLFTTGLFLTLLMLVQAVNGYQKYSFDSRLAPGVLLLVSVLAGYMLSRRLKRAAAFFAVVIAAEIGVVLAFVFPTSWIAALILPAATVALVAMLLRARANVSLKDRRLRRAQLGSDLTHIGVILVIIGYVASGYGSGFERVPLAPGEQAQVHGFVLLLEKIDVEPDTGNQALFEYWDTYVTKIAVLQGGARLDTALLSVTYEKSLATGNYTKLVKANIWVVSTLAGDLYMILKANPADRNSTVVDIYFFPLMALMWGGAVLMVVGMAARFIASPGRDVPGAARRERD